jgi:hypothetical protein
MLIMGRFLEEYLYVLRTATKQFRLYHGPVQVKYNINIRKKVKAKGAVSSSGQCQKLTAGLKKLSLYVNASMYCTFVRYYQHKL